MQNGEQTDFLLPEIRRKKIEEAMGSMDKMLANWRAVGFIFRSLQFNFLTISLSFHSTLGFGFILNRGAGPYPINSLSGHRKNRRPRRRRSRIFPSELSLEKWTLRHIMGFLCCRLGRIDCYVEEQSWCRFLVFHELGYRANPLGESWSLQWVQIDCWIAPFTTTKTFPILRLYFSSRPQLAMKIPQWSVHSESSSLSILKFSQQQPNIPWSKHSKEDP